MEGNNTSEEYFDFYAVLGLERESVGIQKLRSHFGKVDVRPVQKSVYENFYDDGVSLLFEPSSTNASTLVLDSVFLFTKGADKDKYKGYKGKLPHGLDFTMKNADVVKKFGEPDVKPPIGGVVNMYIDYKSLGLHVDFATKSYEDRENPIVSLCLYKPDTSYEKEDKEFIKKQTNSPKCDHCGRVGGDKVTLKFCAGCHKVAYCSAECQKKEWSYHKPSCKPASKE